MMSPNLQTPAPARRPTVTVDRRPRVCACGQDLDVVSTRHCPRCGTELGVGAFDASGFWFAA